MDTIPLSATARPEGEAAGVLRREARVPGVVYGKVENMSVVCDFNELHKAYAQAGESTIIDLSVDGKKTIPVLFHELQLDPVLDHILHVDFYAVDMKKEVEAAVPIVFEGEAPAVKDMGGVMVTTQDHITVKCLPDKLPHEITVSLENMTDFESALHVYDLPVPDDVVILDDPETTIATVQEPRSVIEEEEGEAAEGEEGEAAAESEEKTEEEGEGES